MRWKCSSSQQPAFSAQYERSWRVLPVSGGVPGAIFERARLFFERAGVEPARVRVCRLSVLPYLYAASMSFSSLSSSHVSFFRFTLIPPKTDLSSLSTFMTTCRSLARFSARSSRLAWDLSSRRPAAEVFQQPAASNQQPVRGGSASHWALDCWLLAVETLRSEATPKGCCSRRGLRQARPSSRCVPNRGNCC